MSTPTAMQMSSRGSLFERLRTSFLFSKFKQASDPSARLSTPPSASLDHHKFTSHEDEPTTIDNPRKFGKTMKKMTSRVRKSVKGIFMRKRTIQTVDEKKESNHVLVGARNSSEHPPTIIEVESPARTPSTLGAFGDIQSHQLPSTIESEQITAESTSSAVTTQARTPPTHAAFGDLQPPQLTSTIQPEQITTESTSSAVIAQASLISPSFVTSAASLLSADSLFSNAHTTSSNGSSITSYSTSVLDVSVVHKAKSASSTVVVPIKKLVTISDKSVDLTDCLDVAQYLAFVVLYMLYNLATIISAAFQDAITPIDTITRIKLVIFLMALYGSFGYWICWVASLAFVGMVVVASWDARYKILKVGNRISRFVPVKVVEPSPLCFNF